MWCLLWNCIVMQNTVVGIKKDLLQIECSKTQFRISSIAQNLLKIKSSSTWTSNQPRNKIMKRYKSLRHNMLKLVRIKLKEEWLRQSLQIVNKSRKMQAQDAWRVSHLRISNYNQSVEINQDKSIKKHSSLGIDDQKSYRLKAWPLEMLKLESSSYTFLQLGSAPAPPISRDRKSLPSQKLSRSKEVPCPPAT